MSVQSKSAVLNEKFSGVQNMISVLKIRLAKAVRGTEQWERLFDQYAGKVQELSEITAEMLGLTVEAEEAVIEARQKLERMKRMQEPPKAITFAQFCDRNSIGYDKESAPDGLTHRQRAQMWMDMHPKDDRKIETLIRASKEHPFTNTGKARSKKTRTGSVKTKAG